MPTVRVIWQMIMALNYFLKLNGWQWYYKDVCHFLSFPAFFCSHIKRAESYSMLNTKEVPPVKKLCSEAIKVTHVFRKRRTQNNAIVWGSPNGAHFFKTMIFPKLLSLFWVLRWWLYRNPMSLNHSKPAEEEEDILHTYHNHDATTLADSATNGHLVFPFYSLRGSQSRGGQVHHTSKKGRALEKHQDPKNNHHHFSYLRHLMLVVCHYAYQVFACFETNTHAKMSKRLADGIQ